MFIMQYNIRLYVSMHLLVSLPYLSSLMHGFELFKAVYLVSII